MSGIAKRTTMEGIGEVGLLDALQMIDRGNLLQAGRPQQPQHHQLVQTIAGQTFQARIGQVANSH